MIATATALFVDGGWATTTMASIADAAGLTRQTVYQQFNGKLELLDACIVAALEGDTAREIRDQTDYRAMADGTFEHRIAAAARWLRAAHERGARIQHVLDQAAVTDPAAADRLAQREAARWREVEYASTMLVGRRPSDDAIDTMWMLASRRWWLTLVGDRGWDGDRWEQWFITLTTATLDGRSSSKPDLSITT